MNEIQKLLRDTEKDFLSDSPSHTPDIYRLKAIERLDREISTLLKRRERLENGLDDFMLY